MQLPISDISLKWTTPNNILLKWQKDLLRFEDKQRFSDTLQRPDPPTDFTVGTFRPWPPDHPWLPSRGSFQGRPWCWWSPGPVECCGPFQLWRPSCSGWRSVGPRPGLASGTQTSGRTPHRPSGWRPWWQALKDCWYKIPFSWTLGQVVFEKRPSSSKQSFVCKFFLAGFGIWTHGLWLEVLPPEGMEITFTYIHTLVW